MCLDLQAGQDGSLLLHSVIHGVVYTGDQRSHLCMGSGWQAIERQKRFDSVAAGRQSLANDYLKLQRFQQSQHSSL